MEKMAHDTADKVKQINEWQKSVNERLDNLERVKGVERIQLAPLVVVDHDTSDDSDANNEPPVSAVSQRRDADKVTTRVDSNKSQGQTNVPNAPRKRFPPRNMQVTPNPRMSAKQAVKGPNTKSENKVIPGSSANVKGNASKNVRSGNSAEKQTTYFDEENPYSALALPSEPKDNAGAQRKTATRGRGRMRRQASAARPGGVTRQPPVEENHDDQQCDKSDMTPPEPSNTTDHDMDPLHANDISSSWYDEEDDLGDQSLITAVGSDDAAGEDDNLDPDNLPQENEPTMERANIPREERDKGRKRTSTKEAPIDSPPQATGKGKSTAPVNKKPKIDSRRKNTYAESLDNGIWITPESKKYKRSKLGNKKVPELRSAAQMALREVYVQELDCTSCSCSEEFEDMVIEYCRKRGLRAVDACTIPVKGNRLKSGCKLTVRDSDYDTAMSRKFWPPGTSLRPWKQKPRSDSNEDDEGSTSE